MKNYFIAMATLINSLEVSEAIPSQQERMPNFVLHMEMQLLPRCSLDSLQPCISMSSLLSTGIRPDCDTDRHTPLTQCLAHLFTYSSRYLYKM